MAVVAISLVYWLMAGMDVAQGLVAIIGYSLDSAFVFFSFFLYIVPTFLLYVWNFFSGSRAVFLFFFPVNCLSFFYSCSSLKVERGR